MGTLAISPTPDVRVAAGREVNSRSYLPRGLPEAGPLLSPEHFLTIPGAQATADAAAPLTDLDRFIEERLEAGSRDLYAEWRDLTEPRLFARVLRHFGGNLSQAARALGIHRATLRSRVAELGLAAPAERVEKAPAGD